MPQAALRISLSEQERETLMAWSRSGAIEHRMVERARVILLAAEGVSAREIARRLHTRLARVSKWRQRFGRDRLAGLEDAPRTGKPKTYGQQAEQRILALVDSDPPEGYSQWNGRLLAKHLGDVSDDQVWRVLRPLGTLGTLGTLRTDTPVALLPASPISFSRPYRPSTRRRSSCFGRSR